jgi:hypothetical protein
MKAVFYINDVPHSGRGVGRLSRMDFEISGRSKRAWRIDYISVGSKKELQLLLLLLGTEVLEKL